MSQDYKKRQWYMSDEQYDELRGGRDSDNDIIWLMPNGLISPNLAEFVFYAARAQDYDIPKCLKCGNGPSSNHAYRLAKEYRWQCKTCRYHYSITSGTYIDNCKLSFSQLWRFCWLVGDIGLINSVKIAEDIATTQATSWGLLETLKQSRKDEYAPNKFKTGSEILSGLDHDDLINLLVRIPPNDLHPSK